MRRWPHFILCIYSLALMSLAACARVVVQPAGPTAAPAMAASSTPERSAVVREVTGEAEVRVDAGADWAATSAGLILNVGSQFRTGAGSQALLQLTEGSKLRLGQDTAFTLNLLNPYMDSLLTSVALEHGSAWVMLAPGSALDVETPVGLAAARASYLSVAYDAAQQTVFVTCLQGVCSFDKTFIPAGYKYRQQGQTPAVPEPMTLADYGLWGTTVPEATELAPMATEAVVQGGATLPIAAVTTAAPPATDTPLPSATLTSPPAASAETQAPPPSATPTAAAPPTTRPPTAPRTPLPVMGQHLVLAGETIFCLARVYGVLPDAIVQANNLTAPYILKAGETVLIPAVRWDQILPGPVCAPQFTSTFPGLPYVPATAAPPASPTAPAETPTLGAPLLIKEVAALCIGNCNDPAQPTYRLLVIVTAAGGVEPLTYDPGQQSEADYPRCLTSSGTVTVRSADGQVATSSWVYDDRACTPLPAPPTPLTPQP